MAKATYRRVYSGFLFQRARSWTGGPATCAGWSRMLRAYILNHKQESKRINWEWCMAFETHSSDTLPPTGPHLLNLPQHCYQLGTKYSNAKTMGDRLIQNTTVWVHLFPLWFLHLPQVQRRLFWALMWFHMVREHTLDFRCGVCFMDQDLVHFKTASF